MSQTLRPAGAMCAAILLVAGCRIEREAVMDSTPADTVAGAPSALDCGVTDATSVTGDGVGELRIGRPIGDVKAVCRFVIDTEIEREGQPARVTVFELPRDTAWVETVNDTVWRIELRSDAFRTADSIGVGTRLEQLMALPRITGAIGEGQIYAMTPAHCGMSFRLDARLPQGPGALAGAALLRRLPANTRVDRVLLVGCQ